MRHWIGVGLAIVTAAALFLGGGWGVTRMSALPAEGMGLTSPRGLSAGACRCAAVGHLRPTPTASSPFFLCRGRDRGQRYCSRACEAHARRVVLSFGSRTHDGALHR